MSLPEIPGYRPVKLLHEGSRATVYLAEQRSLQRLVALKLLRPGMAGDPVARQQLIGEGKSAAPMSHPNLLAVFDIGEVGGLPYIATEYLPKGTLRERLDQSFDAATVLRLARDLAQGLKYLHEQGFLHRDLKPSNVYFRDDGTAVLADAGITRQDRAQHPDDGYAWGSPYYMCPEQAQGDPTDVRSDLYSLGAVLYEVLAGRPPFDGEDPMAIAMAHVQDTPAPLPEGTRGWQPLIDRLLAKSPAARLRDADTLLIALERISARVLPAPDTPAAPAETRGNLEKPRLTSGGNSENQGLEGTQPDPHRGFSSPVPAPSAPAETMVAVPLTGRSAPAETLVAAPLSSGGTRDPIAPPEPASTIVLPGSPDAGPTVVAPPLAAATQVLGGSSPSPMPPAIPPTMVQPPLPPPVPMGGATVVRPPVAGPLPGDRPAAPARPSPWPWIVLSVVLIIGTVLLFAWWGSRKPAGNPPVPAASSEADPAVAGTIEEWVRRAQRYDEREEWINTDGDGNAVQAWRQVLQRDPDHRGAKAALIRIREDVRSQVAAAIRAGQMTTARALLEQAVLAFPEDPEFRLKLTELQAATR
jgi:serine/threonine-protein kinase PpkA